MSRVLGIVYRVIATHLIKQARQPHPNIEEKKPINDLMGHSITYLIAVGPQAGRKVFTL